MATKASDGFGQSAFEARIWRAESTGREEYQDDKTGKWRERPVIHSAGWAVYDTVSGVRIAYAHNESDARAAPQRSGTLERSPKKSRGKSSQPENCGNFSNPATLFTPFSGTCHGQA